MNKFYSSIKLNHLFVLGVIASVAITFLVTMLIISFILSIFFIVFDPNSSDVIMDFISENLQFWLIMIVVFTIFSLAFFFGFLFLKKRLDFKANEFDILEVRMKRAKRFAISYAIQVFAILGFFVYTSINSYVGVYEKSFEEIEISIDKEMNRLGKQYVSDAHQNDHRKLIAESCFNNKPVNIFIRNDNPSALPHQSEEIKISCKQNLDSDTRWDIKIVSNE